MLSKRARLWLGIIAALSLLSLASSCKPTTETNENTGGPSVAAYPSKGNEGSITGKISYNGTAPEAKKIDTSADANCASKSPNLMTEDWVVKNGKLANTFVYIKDGTIEGAKKISEYGWPTPSSAVTLDQNGCHYRPHVLGVVVNEPITIKNSDPTTHNIHFTPKSNPDWNQSQPNGAAPLTHKLARAEVLVPVKCNQHPWMKMYVNVVKSPFYAVTDKTGKYEIKGLPPGDYTIAFVHEKLGEQDQKVTVAPKDTKTVDTTFKAGAGE